jgi:hypothetical protein
MTNVNVMNQRSNVTEGIKESIPNFYWEISVVTHDLSVDRTYQHNGHRYCPKKLLRIEGWIARFSTSIQIMWGFDFLIICLFSLCSKKKLTGQSWRDDPKFTNLFLSPKQDFYIFDLFPNIFPFFLSKFQEYSQFHRQL